MLKKIIIYGKNRYQRDFEYIFEQYEVAYYVDEEEILNEVYHFSKLKDEDFNKICVIICVAEKEQLNAKQNLRTLGLIEKRHYFVMDELFSLLDIDVETIMKEKKVVLWGTGNIATNFMQQISNYYPEMKIDYVVDNDEEKEGTEFCGYEIIPMSKLKKEHEYYIIIAISSFGYKELIKDLNKYKLNEVHIFSGKFLMQKPSELLKRTIYDENQFSINCHKINDMHTLPNGDIKPCCFARDIILGNVFNNNISEVWNSVYEKIFRLSLLNRTYTFCSSWDWGCPYLVHKKQKGMEIFHYKDNKPVQPRMLTLELDYSCNLMCVSCRNSILKVENNFFDAYAEKIIKEYIPECNRIFLMGSGEIFTSKYAKKIILSEESLIKKEISVISNGFAFNEHNWEKYLKNYDKIDVAISIDAGTKETYEKIRRKSNWEVLNKNLGFIKKLKLKGKVGFFQINFVVYKMNIQEMEDFIKLGKVYNVDRVQFSRLDDWGLPDNWYYNNSILDEDYKIKEEYKNYFDKILNEEIVDFHNLSNQLNKGEKEFYIW